MEILHALFMQGGDVRRERRTLPTRTTQNAHLARTCHADSSTHGHKHGADLTTHQVGERRRRAFVGNMRHLHTATQLE